MKTWDDLSDVDKEKLNAYFNMTLSNKMLYITLSAVMYLGAFLGIALIMLPSIYTFMGGTAVMLVVLFLAFWTLKKIEQFKKKVKLVFDVDDILEDVFEIDESDLKKVKRKLVKIK